MMVLYLQCAIKGFRSKKPTTWKVQQGMSQTKQRIMTQTRGWHMSNQLLIVRSRCVSLLITVILADVNRCRRKTLLFAGMFLKSLGSMVSSFHSGNTWYNRCYVESCVRQINFVRGDQARILFAIIIMISLLTTTGWVLESRCLWKQNQRDPRSQ